MTESYLGRIFEQRGERARARSHYEAFLRYWGEGDFERDRVEAARKYLTS